MVTDSLTVRDNRTGQEYDVPITDGTIRASDIGQIKAAQDAPGLAVYDPGFVNTASCRSAVTYIDGEQGILEYRGYPIEQLAEKSTFLEVGYLLVHGSLPTKQEYDAWVHEITYHTFVHENVKEFMQGFRYDAHPMGMLMASVGALSTFYPDARNIGDADNRHMQIVRMIAKMPTLGAWSFRHAQGKPFVYPDNELSYTANFLSMLFKMSEQKFDADERLVKALDVLFILHADHEQNCSTNAVRSVGSSQVDPYSAVAAGVAALYGPLHGGANEAVLRMLKRIGSKENIPDFIKGVKDGNERLMGFGHRVYKNYDPRAKIIKKGLRRRLRGHRREPAPRDRPGAGEDRARGRVLRQAQALPQRRLLLRPHLRGLPVPARDVHRAVRDRPDPRLAGPVAGARAGQGAEDRPAQADLHRRPHARLRTSERTLGIASGGLDEFHRVPGETHASPTKVEPDSVSYVREGSARGVIWDLGDVLIKWSPYAAVAAGVGEEEARRFLEAEDFDFLAWNHVQDAGGTWSEGVDALRRSHPHWERHALAYRENFEAALVGEVPGTADLVRELHAAGVPQFGLTNWSDELYPHAPRLFPVLDLLDDIVVSGTEKVAKPDPAIFEIAIARSGLEASELVFVDDKEGNVAAAIECGLDGVLFTGADDLRRRLRERGLPA
jgi:citrate synthase